MLFFFFRIVYNNYTERLYMDKIFKKLDEIIDKFDDFIIMSHVNPDLDALGSSLGLYNILLNRNKKVSIFLDSRDLSIYDDSVKKSIEKLNSISFVNKDNYSVNDNACLIILDVHSSKRLYDDCILDKVSNIVILDHHIRRRDYIHNTIYTYINSNLSSMVELISFYLKYSNVSIDSIVASIMLAGLEIDTNNYNLKTTNKTYLAASYLMEMGADIILKQELLKETKDEYVRRADYIKQSFKINDSIAMCILTDNVETSELSEIADDLLKLVDVQASFAIGYIEDKVGVSCRSMGKLDVEKIASKLGGGGSKTNAALQSDLSIREIKNKIIQLVG